jgi:potassium-transporting ATPase KdpC subunit
MGRHLVRAIGMLIILTVALGFGYPLVLSGLSAVAFNHQANGSLVYRNGALVGSSLLGQSFTTAAGVPIRRYFQPRPSAAGAGYAATSSGTTNLGPSNPLLIGFVPGVNTVGRNGGPSATNPFATRADPSCVPVNRQGVAVTEPVLGDQYAKKSDGTYVCDPDTIPERSIAYRLLNGLAAGASVPADAVTDSGSGLDPDISVANALDQARRVADARHLSLHRVLTLVHRYTDGPDLGFLGAPSVNVLALNLGLDRIR